MDEKKEEKNTVYHKGTIKFSKKNQLFHAVWESSPDSKELPISISSCTYVLNIPSNYWSDFATCILSGQWHQR